MIIALLVLIVIAILFPGLLRLLIVLIVAGGIYIATHDPSSRDRSAITNTNAAATADSNDGAEHE